MNALKRVPSWAWLTAIAAILRLINIGGESLWYDESFTAWLARLPLSNMWAAIRGDVHPPGWYLIEWVTVHLLGSSELALRLPAALLGVGAVILVWRLALAVGLDRRAAFVAGLLAAVLPAAIYYSDDARMYPLLACGVLGATLAAIRGRWLLFILCCIVACYAQNLGVLYVFALGSVLLIQRWRSWRSFSSMAAALAMIMGAWLPWLFGGLLHQVQQVSQGFWLQPVTLPGLLWPMLSMTIGTRLPDALQLHFYALALGWSAISLLTARRWLMSRPGMLLLSVVFGAPALAGLISVLWRSVYLPRAMLPSTLALCILWAWPIMRTAPANKRALRTIAVPVLLISLAFYYTPTMARQPIRDWAAIIRQNWQPGDVLYHPAVDSAILLTYYLPDLDYRLMPESNDLNQSLTDETKTAMLFKVGDFDELAKAGYQRAWLILSENPLISPHERDEIEHIEQSYCLTIAFEQFYPLARIAFEVVDLKGTQPCKSYPILESRLSSHPK